MSYAGLYEPCPHGGYARNCAKCNGSEARFERELPTRLKHPADAKSIEVKSRVITVYDAECPNSLCSWRRLGVADLAKMQSDLSQHVLHCESVAREWSDPHVRDAWA